MSIWIDFKSEMKNLNGKFIWHPNRKNDLCHVVQNDGQGLIYKDYEKVPHSVFITSQSKNKRDWMSHFTCTLNSRFIVASEKLEVLGVKKDLSDTK